MPEPLRLDFWQPQPRKVMEAFDPRNKEEVQEFLGALLNWAPVGCEIKDLVLHASMMMVAATSLAHGYSSKHAVALTLS